MKIINVDFPIFQIVGDAIISTEALAEGRFIPALMIDIGENLEVSELITLHHHIGSGDAESAWTRPVSIFKIKSVVLSVRFLKPKELKFGIEFILSKHYALIDGIIQSRGFYFQDGKKGDKVGDKGPKILVEVPPLDFDKNWGEMFLSTLIAEFKKKGASKKDARQLAESQIKSMREIWNIRRK